MPNLLTNIRIHVNDKIYLKDPYTSDLGREILTKALPFIEDLGLEGFTFKKLATEIGTTESAIYRYFENKHKLLLYYVSWYWGWMEYNIVFGTANILSPEERLRITIKELISSSPVRWVAPFDLKLLQKVVVAESAKAYLTKDVDTENREGLFSQFKNVCSRVSTSISEIAPEYPYPRTLALTFLESHLGQLYFANHIKSLTDVDASDEQRYKFYEELIFNTIEKWRILKK